MVKKEKRDLDEPCLPCKLITISCLFGISAYLIYQGKMQSKKSRYSMYSLATAVGALGVGEIFDKSPFRDTT